MDLVGIRFGKLIVKERLGAGKDGKVRWGCLCDCGKSSITKTNYLTSGQTKSCGCIKKSVLGEMTKKHGMSQSRIYNIWSLIKRRCYNKNSPNYKNYGGRGIKMCDRWKNSFDNFYEDMKLKYSIRLTIDRVDNDGDYCLENCRWADRFEQMNNMRRNKVITFNGKTMTMTEWAKETGINYSTIRARLRKGLSVKRALTKMV